MSGKINAASIVADESKASIMSIVNSESLNTSQKIRALAAEQVDRSTIANLLNKRYQHVRNVLMTKLSRDS